MAEMLPVPREEKSVLLHTQKAGPGVGAQTVPRDGWSPRGGLQSLTATGAWSELYRAG